MGGGVRSKNPTRCCPENAASSCKPRQCGDHGNVFTAYTSNSFAEFNIFGDPFAAYQARNNFDAANDKEERKLELEKKLHVLNEKKHNLVQMLKQDVGGCNRVTLSKEKVTG
ncbi:hypothetical protein Cni_G06250 [Canna indica]|uniref:Uncharacterized protein n=1 Tax=Canna indica TaxID=4628 RepID=A0AAQ3JWP0_9LILI|nr:hypothetical protein Cni_G06250 [Canna indica]